jgi:uncharacterized protein YdeI (BOF family)
LFYSIFSYLFYASVPLAGAMEKTNADMGSYEGRYPKDLFNKVVVVNGQSIGHVTKETDDLIVVFSDSDNSRFDIPKSKVALVGGSVVLDESVGQYAVDRDAPLPESRSLRPSTEEIIQKAGSAPEEPALPAEEYNPSVAEEKAKEVASELKGVGDELERAARTTKEKVEDVGAAAASDLGEAARRAAGGASDLAQTGARVVREKVATAKSNADAGLSTENALKIDKEMRRPDEPDLASYEGKYPKELFNKTVLLNNQPVGHVVKETDDDIVVFSDTDSSIRFDIPKSEITLTGSSIVANEDLLFRYRKRKDEPMPPDRALRPSAQEIRAAAAKQLEVEDKRRTTPEVVTEEGGYLAAMPRPETTVVSIPEGYVDTESELSKKIKMALAELKEIIVAGTNLAKKKAEEAQLQAAEKKAEMDGKAISRMGDLSMRFADSFEEVLSEIRTRTYADQEQIYAGFLKLIDMQRDMVVARRDLARRLKDSVTVPVVADKPSLEAPPELPEDINESRALTERRTKIVKRKQTSKRVRKRKS